MERHLALEILKDLIKHDLVLPDTEEQVLRVVISKLHDWQEDNLLFTQTSFYETYSKKE